MLARDRLECREPRFDPFLPRWIGFERIGVSAEARQRLARRDGRLFELRRRRLERRIQGE
jgi:hypothetical protein